MNVLKFGGTSVGSVAQIQKVAGLIQHNGKKIVVLSAMSGTTDALVEISDFLYKKDHESAIEKIRLLSSKYEKIIEELFKKEEYQKRGKELIRQHFDFIKSFTRDMFTQFEEKAVLAQGELISTALMHYYLEEQGVSSVLLSALNFMRIDKDMEPDGFYIRENLERELKLYPEGQIFITQGYICRNAYGEIDNLKRGGSDFTASLIGAAIAADEIQIWTDIDGVHNNDPRIVEETHAISELSFDEAAELAYFGAKILHPTSVLPAKLADIPVRIKNTLDPDAPGTLISRHCKKERIRAIAAKDGITVIKIKSGRMLLAHGFLRKVFEIFESYKTSIDMVTTSEVGVSITIDDDKYEREIVESLRKYGTVEVDKNQVIICVVGDLIAENKGIAHEIFYALREIPLRMISYGGSNHNISILVSVNYKAQALVALSKNLFKNGHNE